ncbi:MAG: hypothetical protein ACOXZ4_06910 [Sphaerochaetaceae bacterium]|jgi:hypothetical protein
MIEEVLSKSDARRRAEILSLEQEIAAKRQEQQKMQQQLFDLAKRVEPEGPSMALVLETEHLKREISNMVISLRHLDIRLSRLKHRARRLRRMRG